jgi:hypothetical protein
MTNKNTKERKNSNPMSDLKETHPHNFYLETRNKNNQNGTDTCKEYQAIARQSAQVDTLGRREA